jgi:hypothetical protein
MPGVYSFQRLPLRCPPEDAANQAIDPAFYFCYGFPPTEADFVPLATRGAARPYRNAEAQCHACGISIFRDIRDAHSLRAVPKFRAMILVAISITPDDGVVKHTANVDHPSHHTFWSYDDAPFRETARMVLLEDQQ